MAFFNDSEILDVKRLSRCAKATVQSTGRLGFSAEAAAMMGLSEDKRIIFAEPKCAPGDLGAVVVEKDNTRGFELRKAGDYFYIRMKNYFDQAMMDYRNRRYVYDISELGEEYEGARVFKLSRREIHKGDASKEDVNDETES